MKKYLIKIVSLIILFIFVIGTPYSSFAGKPGEKMDTSITSDQFIKDFNPENELEDGAKEIATPITKTIKEIVNTILGIIQLIGGILTVVSVTIFGLGMIVKTHPPLANDLNLKIGKNGPHEIKDLLDFGRSLVIGAVLLFASSTLVRLVLNIFIS